MADSKFHPCGLPYNIKDLPTMEDTTSPFNIAEEILFGLAKMEESINGSNNGGFKDMRSKPRYKKWASI
jgi:hypothetical protein